MTVLGSELYILRLSMRREKEKEKLPRCMCVSVYEYTYYKYVPADVPGRPGVSVTGIRCGMHQVQRIRFFTARYLHIVLMVPGTILLLLRMDLYVLWGHTLL